MQFIILSLNICYRGEELEFREKVSNNKYHGAQQRQQHNTVADINSSRSAKRQVFKMLADADCAFIRFLIPGTSSPHQQNF